MARHDDGNYQLPPIVSVDRIPPGILRQPDPIYPPIKAKAYRACRKFYDRAKAFLDGKGAAPKVQPVLKAAIPHGSLLQADLDKDALGPKVLLKIEDLDRRFEKDGRSPRWFDPEYLPVLIMLAYAGASFRFDDKRRKKDAQGNLIDRNKRRMLVSFGRGSDGNVSVLRILWDASSGYQVYRTGAKADQNYHYEYRRAALDERNDDRVRDEGRPAKTARRGRRYAIRLAGSYLERALAKGEKLAAPSLTRAQYEELLHDMFEIADQLYLARQEAAGKNGKA